MQNILQSTLAHSYTTPAQPSVFAKFITWCASQEKNHFGWLGGILAFHGCILTPITLFAVILAGTNIFLFVAALVAMGMSLVTNLAAMPTKVTIPVFLLSVVIDLSVIITCAAIGFNIATTYI